VGTEVFGFGYFGFGSGYFGSVFGSRLFFPRLSCPEALYSDASCKDAHVHPELPVPNCDCGKPAHVFESKHLDTAARAFYTYGDCCVSNCL